MSLALTTSSQGVVWYSSPKQFKQRYGAKKQCKSTVLFSHHWSWLQHRTSDWLTSISSLVDISSLICNLPYHIDWKASDSFPFQSHHMTMAKKYVWTALPPQASLRDYLGMFQFRCLFWSHSVIFTLAVLQAQISHRVCRHWGSVLRNTCRRGMAGAGERSTWAHRPGAYVPGMPPAGSHSVPSFLKITWLGSMSCLCKSHWWILNS